MAHRRLLSTATARATAVGNFSGLRVIKDPATGGEALIAARAFAKADIIFRFTGLMRRDNIGDRSLMVGREAHLISIPEEEQPWVFLNHSFSPTLLLSHALVESAEAPPPVLTATANHDLEEGDALTFDYTLHEWEMHGEGFDCAETGRRVRGFRYLTEKEQDAALPRAMAHVRSLHLQHLFGQSSRC